MRPRPERPACLDTPGLSWRSRKSGWTAYWVARADLVARGYAPKTVRLWPPSVGAGPEPTADEWKLIGSACTRLQDEMLEWASAATGTWDAQRVYDGTIDSLIHVYLKDPDSPFKGLRYATSLKYESVLRTLSATVGKRRVPSLTFRDFKRWHENFAKPVKDGAAPRIARAHSLMTHIRLLMSFGTLVGLDGCEASQKTLAGMEFRMPKKRTVFITAAQAIAIRQEAHRQQMPSVALAQALMFELMLRQKDVLGEYVPLTEPGMSEVVNHGRKWLHGLHWKEVSDDFVLTHRLSKSIKGREAINDPQAGKIETFDLKAYPMVMEELVHITDRTGPIVKREATGRPWDSKSFNRAWRKIATAAGVPANVQNRDSRAGGITEALDSAAIPDQVRRHAGHSQLGTTMIYARDSLEAKAQVVALRVKNRPKT